MIEEIKQILKTNQETYTNSLNMIKELKEVRVKYGARFSWEQKGGLPVYYLNDDSLPTVENATAQFIRLTNEEILKILPLKSSYPDKGVHDTKFEDASGFYFWASDLNPSIILRDLKTDLKNYHTQKAEFYFKHNILTINNMNALGSYGFKSFQRLLFVIAYLKYNKILKPVFYSNIWKLINKNNKITALKTNFRVYKNGKVEVIFKDKMLLEKMKGFLND